jgi:hypothetical protein
MPIDGKAILMPPEGHFTLFFPLLRDNETHSISDVICRSRQAVFPLIEESEKSRVPLETNNPGEKDPFSCTFLPSTMEDRIIFVARLSTEVR